MSTPYKPRFYPKKIVGSTKPKEDSSFKTTQAKLSKAMREISILQKTSAAELKYHDYNILGQTIDNAGLVYPLTQVAQASTAGGRNGNQIKSKDILFNFRIGMNTNAPFCQVMVCIVADTMNQGTNPTTTQILETTGTASAPLQHEDQGQRGRFVILRKELISFSAAGQGAKTTRWAIPFSRKLLYTGILGTDTFRDSVYAVIISDQVVTSLPSVDFCSRLRFYDN